MENEFKGTKGNWVLMASGHGDYIQVFVEDSKTPIRSILYKPFNPESNHFSQEYFNEWKANAQIISKAPEMLEILKKAQNIYGRDFESNKGMDVTIGRKLYLEIEKLIKEATTI